MAAWPLDTSAEKPVCVWPAEVMLCIIKSSLNFYGISKMWLRWRCRRWWPPLQGGQEIVHSIFSWRVTSILEKSCSSIIQRVVSHEKWALSSLFLSVCAHDLKYCLEKVQPYFWLRRKTFKKWRDFPLHNFRFALGPNHETKQRAKKCLEPPWWR